MPTMKESEMSHEVDYCTLCGEYAGDIFLCGEGMICTRCFAEEAGLDESEVFGEISQEDRNKVKASISNKIDGE